MNAATPEQIRIAIESGWSMRQGRKLKRTLYLHNPLIANPDHDLCVGIVDSEELADAIKLRWNMHLMHQDIHRGRGG